MNRYEPCLPRARLGLTAVAMAVLTMATLVALPAKLESAVAEPHMVVAAKVALASSGRGSARPS